MKLHKLSEAAKFLIIAGTILIVCTLVVVGFFVMKEGKEGTNNSMDQFNQVTSEYSDVNRESYDNLTVRGSALRKLIKDELAIGEIKIYFQTLKATAEVEADKKHVYETESNYVKKGETDFINNSGSFKGTVVKDKNGVITSIKFAQTK